MSGQHPSHNAGDPRERSDNSRSRTQTLSSPAASWAVSGLEYSARDMGSEDIPSLESDSKEDSGSDAASSVSPATDDLDASFLDTDGSLSGLLSIARPESYFQQQLRLRNYATSAASAAYPLREWLSDPDGPRSPIDSRYHAEVQQAKIEALNVDVDTMFPVVADQNGAWSPDAARHQSGDQGCTGPPESIAHAGAWCSGNE